MSNTTPPHILAMLQSTTFTPSNRMIRARKLFWDVPGQEVQPDAEGPSVAALAPLDWISKLVSKSWSTPGFPDWFTSPEWEREESARLMNLALQRLGEVLEDADEHSIVISAAKETREVYTRLNSNANNTSKFADAELDSMDKAQLEEFIRRQTSLINSVNSKK